jgi:uncharacterized coiled-coil protein SlyX
MSDHPYEPRLQETEIKIAFLERELEEYKDAVQTLHARLQTLEALVEALRRKGQAHGAGHGDSSGDNSHDS